MSDSRLHPVTGVAITRACRQCGEQRHIQLDYRRNSRVCRPCARKASVAATYERRRKERQVRVPSGTLRRCVICGDHQDSAVSFRENRNKCRSCEQRENTRKKADRREVAHGEALAVGVRLPTRSVPHPGPFEITLARLVRKWGPYRTWTRHQHALHTREIQKMTGLPVIPDVEIEAARLADADRTVLRQDSRQKARRAA
jgi:hypothetical protein